MLRTAFVTISLAALCLSTRVWATDVPARGGGGGNAYRQTCDEGEYLVGLRGRTGDWIDSMQLVCARWNGRQLDPPHVAGAPIGNSTGGVANHADCPGEAVVTAVGPTFTNADQSRFLDSIALRCVPILTRQKNDSPAYLPNLRSTGVTTRVDHGFGVGVEVQSCPGDELAVGFHGNAGLFIDSVGLVCAAAPSPAAGPGKQLGRANGDPRFGAGVRARGADERSTAGTTVEKSVGSTSVGGIRTSNELGSVAPPPAAAPAAPPPSSGQHFTPPTFPDGSRLWACTDVGDAVCEGHAASTAYCATLGFNGPSLNSRPHLIDRGVVQVKNVRGEACTHRRCAVLDDVTCSR